MTRVITGSDGRKYLTDEPLLHPPKHEWVGLTDADFDKEKFVDYNFMAGTRFAEAKLKEKNT